MNVKYVLVGYLSLSFLCCLFCFFFDRTILLHFHPTRHAVPHPTNSPSSLPSWPLQLVAQPVVPPLHQSQALPPHPETGKPGHVDAFHDFRFRSLFSKLFSYHEETPPFEGLQRWGNLLLRFGRGELKFYFHGGCTAYNHSGKQTCS